MAVHTQGLSSRRKRHHDARAVADREHSQTYAWWTSGPVGGVNRLDADHLPASALRAVAQRHPGELLITLPVISRLVDPRRCGCVQHLSTLRQLVCAVAVGQQTVVSDSLEPRR